MKKSSLFILLIFSCLLYSQNPGDYLFNTPIIHTIKIYFNQPNWYDSLIYYKPLDIKMKGDIEIDGYYISSVGIQFKGNSSFNVPSRKKSWKIDFNKFVSGQKFDGVKTINLNNVFKDPSFLREKIALDFCQKQGIPAPRCSYANVYVNDTLWGFYTLVEQVNTTFLKNWFNENNGNLFKGDPQGTLQWLGISPSNYYSKYELKTNDSVNDWNDLVYLIDVINNKPASQFFDSLENTLNTSSFIKSWAFNILFVNLDSYQGSGHNYYAYHNLNTNKFEWILWDVNEVCGNFNMGMNITQLENLSIFYIPSPVNNRPLTNNMLLNNTYKNYYINELCSMVSSDFDTSYLFHKIDSLVPIIRPYVYADPQKFYSNIQFETNINSNITSGPFTIPGIKSFIINRRNSVVNQLAINNCIMSIADNNAFTDIKIYPNPTSDIIHFQINSSSTASEFDFHLFDVLGKEIKSYHFKPSNNLDVLTLDMKDLESGVYFYQIISKSKNNYNGKLYFLKNDNQK